LRRREGWRGRCWRKWCWRRRQCSELATDENPDADEAVCVPRLGKMQVVEELDVLREGVRTE
jgi:hypothetical protein